MCAPASYRKHTNSVTHTQHTAHSTQPALSLMLNLGLFVLICLHLMMEHSRTANEVESQWEKERDSVVYKHTFLFVHQQKIIYECSVVGVALDSVSPEIDAKRFGFISSEIRVIGEWNIANFVSFQINWIFFNFIFFACSCPCSCWYGCRWWR